MAGASDPFNFAEKVGLRLVVVAVMFVAQFLDLDAIGCTQVLSYYFLCYVPTNIFSVVALLFDLLLLFLRFEQFGTVIVILVDGIIGEKERAFAVGGSKKQFSKNRIV